MILFFEMVSSSSAFWHRNRKRRVPVIVHIPCTSVSSTGQFKNGAQLPCRPQLRHYFDRRTSGRFFRLETKKTTVATTATAEQQVEEYKRCVLNL